MNATMEKVVNERCGFMTSEDVAEQAKETPDMLVMIRTGSNRYTCRIDQVNDTIKTIEAEGDYVRDVALPSENYDRIKNEMPYIKSLGVNKIHN